MSAQLFEGKGAWRGGPGGTGTPIANVRVEASKGQKRKASGKGSATFGDHGTVVSLVANVKGAKLWSAEDPNLYTLIITLEKGNVCWLVCVRVHACVANDFGAVFAHLR